MEEETLTKILGIILMECDTRINYKALTVKDAKVSFRFIRDQANKALGKKKEKKFTTSQQERMDTAKANGAFTLSRTHYKMKVEKK